MVLVSRIIALAGLVFASSLLPGGAALAGSCVPAGVSNVCTVVANQDVNSLDPLNSQSPLATGITFSAGSTYVLTVANPLTTTWSYDPGLPSVTADGSGPGLSVGALIGQVGGASNNVGAFAVSTLGALAVNGAVTNGLGGAFSYTTGGTLTLAMQDSDTFNNSGSQTVTVTQAPTVGGLVLANVNVFAKDNSLTAAPVAAYSFGVSSNFRIEVTDAGHLWEAHDLDPTRLSTADGLGAFASCGPTANIYGETCGAPGSLGVGESAAGFRYGELVARIGGKYYGVGTGRSFAGLSGAVELLYWDSYAPDNLGFMNVSVLALRSEVPADAPEPASLALVASGLAGLALLRRRKAS